MLSNKFILIILVVIVLVFGLAFFPTFNTIFRDLPTTGVYPFSTQIAGIQRFFPYFLFFVIFYAGYVVWKRGR